MRIAYSSQQSLRDARPDPRVTVITLSDTATEVEENRNTKWKKHYVYPFKVLQPSGPNGSFLPMREQAKAFAEWFKTNYTEGDVIVQCQYGEIRSRAIAIGIHIGMRFNFPVELYSLVKGNWAFDKSGSRELGRFETQTYHTIGKVLRTHYTGLAPLPEKA